MYSIVSSSLLLLLFLPMVIFFFNKGYRNANAYLASYLLFSSLCLVESFILFYDKSLSSIAFASTLHASLYLIGPSAFFYIRSLFRENYKLSKLDYLHYTVFMVSLIGYFPYFLTSWTNKRLVAQSTMADNWNLSQFDLNYLFSPQVDQILSVMHSCFYTISLWYLIRHFKKPAASYIVEIKHPKMIQNWPFIFSAIHSILVITWTVAMPSSWLYVDKITFWDVASEVLLSVSLIYVGFNMIIMCSPSIMYRLFTDSPLTAINSKTINKNESYRHLALEQALPAEGDLKRKTLNTALQLFTPAYIDIIHASLANCIQKQSFLSPDCKLTHISNELGIPAHHLTYFFNVIKKTSFADWRNKLRIEYALELMSQGATSIITLEALSLKCGFTSQSTFIRAFKKVTGTSPSNYLKSLL